MGHDQASVDTAADAERFDRALRGAQVGDASLNALAHLAKDLRGLDASARPEFVAGLRSQLLDPARRGSAVTAGSHSRSSSPSGSTGGTRAKSRYRVPPRQGRRLRRPRARVAAALIAAAIAASTSGVAAAADHAKPGTILYPIKRSLESIKIEAEGDPAGRGRAQLRLATLRLQEAQAEQHHSSLEPFSKLAVDGAKQLFASFQSTADRADIFTVRAFADDALETLQQMAGDSTESQDGVPSDIRKAAAMLIDIESDAHILCNSCTPRPSAALWAQ